MSKRDCSSARPTRIEPRHAAAKQAERLFIAPQASTAKRRFRIMARARTHLQPQRRCVAVLLLACCVSGRRHRILSIPAASSATRSAAQERRSERCPGTAPSFFFPTPVQLVAQSRPPVQIWEHPAALDCPPPRRLLEGKCSAAAHTLEIRSDAGGCNALCGASLPGQRICLTGCTAVSPSSLYHHATVYPVALTIPGQVFDSTCAVEAQIPDRACFPPFCHRCIADGSPWVTSSWTNCCGGYGFGSYCV